MSSYVYIIEAQNGVAKIGCARDPHQRLATVRTHSPVLTRLISIWPGTYADERALHGKFEEYRLASEWFQIDGRFRRFFVEQSGKGVDKIPDWSSLTFHSAEERKVRTKTLRQASMRSVWSDPAWKLEQLAALAAGRAISREFGRDCWKNPTDDFRARRRSVHEQAVALFMSSPTAEKLRLEIAAQQQRASA